jgi:teichuronopeptide biosynthesis TupA-like protein
VLAPVRAILPEPAAAAMAVMWRHKESIGTYPNLITPKSFNEKVLRRMVFDRSPIWTQLQDKHAARDYVKGRIGEGILPRLYWVTKDPSDIPFDTLPERFAVKPSHGCGWYHLVREKARLNRQELIDVCRSWLSRNYYYVAREWAYKHIDPRILVEEYIDDGTGPDPIRYKFYVFHGSVRVIYVGAGIPGQARCCFYGPSWNRLPATIARKEQIEGGLDRPRHLDEMIRYAEVLADGFDFIRVDLYDTDDKVYFGEFTITPEAGTSPYTPHEFDYYLGGLWSGRSGVVP